MAGSTLTLSQRKVLSISVLGTALEFYDFTLYSVFALTIANTFFPAERELTSVMAAFAAFAAGFLMRPIGAILIGYIGDHYGRKQALALSILLMGAPALVIALLPGHASWGFTATIIMVLARMLQGLSAGGEFNGAAIFVIEHNKKGRKAFLSSFVSCAGGIGALGAMLCGAVISQPYMPEWAWRLPFAFGSLIAMVGYFLRQYLDESPEFKKAQQTSKSEEGLFELLKNNLYPIALVFSVGAMDGTLAYMLVGFINVYLIKFVGLEIAKTMLFSVFGLIIYLIATPLMGFLFDKSSATNFMNRAFSLCILSSLLVFYFLQVDSITYILLGEALLAVMFAAISGSEHAFMQSLFPTKSRYRGVSLGFNLGSCIFGGTSPLVLIYLIDKYDDLMIPAYFLIFEFVCFLTLMRFLYKKILKSNLTTN